MEDYRQATFFRIKLHGVVLSRKDPPFLLVGFLPQAPRANVSSKWFSKRYGQNERMKKFHSLNLTSNPVKRLSIGAEIMQFFEIAS